MQKFITGVFGFSVVAASSLVGCGGGGNMPSSYDDVVASLKNPTGTVDATSVKAIGPAYEDSLSSGAGMPAAVREDVATRISAETASGEQACSGGGNVAYKAEGSESNAKIEFNYNACKESDCTIDGSGVMFYTTSADAEYTACGGWDLTYTCATADASGTMNFQGCIGGDYGFTYLITVNEKTYKVTGSYSGGNGTLTITGENGTFTCTYTEGSGSCTGDGTIEF